MRKLINIVILLIVGTFLFNCGSKSLGEDIPEEQIKRKALDFAAEFWQGDVDSAYNRFADVLKEQLTREQLNETRESLAKQFGKLKEIGDGVEVTQKGEFYSVVLKCVFEKGNLNLHLTFDKTLEIAGMFYNSDSKRAGEPPGIPEERLKNAAMRFGKEFCEGRLDSAYMRFDEAMKSRVSFDDFSNLQMSVAEQHGGFKAIAEDVTIRKEGSFYVVFLKCELEKGRVNLQITFDQDLKIAGLYFV